jgi:hypothetical protein
VLATKHGVEVGKLAELALLSQNPQEVCAKHDFSLKRLAEISLQIEDPDNPKISLLRGIVHRLLQHGRTEFAKSLLETNRATLEEYDKETGEASEHWPELAILDAQVTAQEVGGRALLAETKAEKLAFIKSNRNQMADQKKEMEESLKKIRADAKKDGREQELESDLLHNEAFVRGLIAQRDAMDRQLVELQKELTAEDKKGEIHTPHAKEENEAHTPCKANSTKGECGIMRRERKLVTRVRRMAKEVQTPAPADKVQKALPTLVMADWVPFQISKGEQVDDVHVPREFFLIRHNTDEEAGSGDEEPEISLVMPGLRVE